MEVSYGADPSLADLVTPAAAETASNENGYVSLESQPSDNLNLMLQKHRAENWFDDVIIALDVWEPGTRRMDG